jgi:uncharacterized hydrophobic protein (TIGR00271 family)
MDIKLLREKAINFIQERFDLHLDKASEPEVIQSIKRGVEFKGMNLWVLIFAIFVASLGLNTNSTAVIIGAMLISPLMGPIMGLGLSVGINDFDLMKRSFKNFAIATIISILTSAVYFLISPLNEAGSELLARTNPTIYDVLIAFFGGMAGIVAIANRDRGNVIPGVAIATALMPPLCTAGYGLASGNLGIFAGAFYLYFINTVFISFAILLGARIFRFDKKEFLDKQREKTVTGYIWTLVVITMIPSIYMGYNIVRSSIFESNAQTFIARELNFPNTQIVNKNIVSTGKDRKIEVFLIGEEVPEMSLQMAHRQMADYNLGHAELVVKQNVHDEQMDVSTLKSLVLEDFYKNSEQRIKEQDVKIEKLNSELNRYTSLNSLSKEIVPELKELFPEIEKISLSLGTTVNIKNMKDESMLVAVVGFTKHPDKAETDKLERWLKVRTKQKSVKLLLE